MDEWMYCKKKWPIPATLLKKDFSTFRNALRIAQWWKVKGLFQTPKNLEWNLKLKWITKINLQKFLSEPNIEAGVVGLLQLVALWTQAVHSIID
jgi:hypothetical protein